MRVSIADRAARSFPPFAILKGYELFSKGNVVLDKVGDASARATVRSKRTQTVRIVFEAGALHVGCTCAPNELDMSPCKHVWASLLAIDRVEGMKTARTSFRIVPIRPLGPEGEKAEPAKKATARTRKRAKSV